MSEPIPVYRAEERAGPPEDDYEPGLPFLRGIIYLTPDNSSGSYLLMQRAIPPQPRGGCYAG